MANTKQGDAVTSFTGNREAPTSEVERLREENAKLRAELADARANAKAVPNTRPVDRAPSFGISEGERAELELSGRTVSPFTGQVRTTK